MSVLVRNTSEEHMSPKMPENMNLVPPETIKSWRVEDREKYVDTVLMDFFDNQF